MKTLANVLQFLTKTGNFYIVVIIAIVWVLLFNSMSVAVVHASWERSMQRKLDEIQSLSSKWNELDEIYLNNQDKIVELNWENMDIKIQQSELAEEAKQKRIEFVQEYGCWVMSGRCEYLKVEVPQKIEFRVNSQWQAKALPKVEPTLEAFAREYGQDPQDFIDAGKEWNVKPEVILCIARADTDLWRAMKSKNNIWNVGNNDRWDTVEYATMREWIFKIWEALNNWYLGNKQFIQDLSRYGNCENDCKYIYASSTENWENNVMNCLNFLYWNI